MTWRRRITPLLPLVAIAGGFVVLNLGYVRTQAAYVIHGPKTVSIPKPGLVVPGRGSATSTANVLAIPSLGITTPIQYVTSTKEAAFQVALRDGVVHYPGTALPGEYGNAYIFGHSSDYSWSKGTFKTVFALLPKIAKGASIIVTDKNGKVFNYTAVSTRVVNPTDLSVLDQQGKAKRLLTVQTSYPIGTALRRFIVVAELTTSTTATSTN